jgi:lambda family phage tail tape measure protein
MALAGTQELLVKLTADATDAVREFKRMGDATEDAAKRVATMQKNIESAFKVLASFKIGDTFVKAIRNSIDALDELSKTSEKTGVSVENLSALNVAAQGAGVSSEQLSKSVGILNKQMGLMGDATAKSTKVLQALNIDPNGDAFDAMKQISDLFQVMPDGAQKTAIAMQVFGKSGAELIPMLNEGGQALDDYHDKAKRLGVLFDTETANQARKVNDNFDDMQQSMKGIVTKVAVGMLPALDALTTSLADSAGAGDDWKEVGDTIGNALVNVTVFAKKAWATFQALGQGIGAVAAALVSVATGEFKQAGNIISEWVADVDSSGAAVDAWEKKFRASFAKAKEGMQVTPGEVVDADKRAELLKRSTDALAAMGKAADETAKKVKDIPVASEALTATQQLVESLIKARDTKIGAFEQLKFLTDNVALLQAVGVSTDQITASIKKLQEETGTRPPLADFQDSLNKSVESANQLPDQIAFLTQSLNDLAAAGQEGSLTWKVYSDALDKANAAMESHKKQTDKTVDSSAALNTALGNVISDGLNSMTDALFDNSKGFKDWAASLIKSLAQVLIKLAAVQLMGMALRAMGFGGLATAVMGKAQGAAFNMKGLEYFAQGGAFHNSILKGITPFAIGGTFPSFAVAGEAGAEAVVPLKRTSSGDLGVQASPVNILIHNTMADSAKVDVATTNKPDGSKEISFTIRREVQAALSDGSMDNTMRGNYGVSRKAVR